jgi:hypothetical protein
MGEWTEFHQTLSGFFFFFFFFNFKTLQTRHFSTLSQGPDFIYSSHPISQPLLKTRYLQGSVVSWWFSCPWLQLQTGRMDRQEYTWIQMKRKKGDEQRAPSRNHAGSRQHIYSVASKVSYSHQPSPSTRKQSSSVESPGPPGLHSPLLPIPLKFRQVMSSLGPRLLFQGRS